MNRIIFILSVAFVAILTLIAIGSIHETKAQTVVGPDGRDQAYLGKPWSTYGTKTDTSDLTLQAAPGASIQVALTEAYCLNTSAATAQAVTITYGSTTIAVLNCPPGAKYQEPTYFDPPIRIPANTLLKADAVASVSTTYIFAEGTTVGIQ